MRMLVGPRTGRRVVILAALAVALTALVGCVPASFSGGATKSGQPWAITVALDWLPNTNHTGIFVARQKGWYAAEGVAVTLLPFSEGTLPEVLVGAGRADVGISFEEAVTQARASGVPLVSIAAVIQKNTSAFIAPRGAGIDRPADFEGKRFAGYGAPFEEPVIEAMIRCDGGATGKVQHITTNVGGFEAVQARQADFVWIFLGWEGIAAQRQKLDFVAFSPTDYCIPDYYTPVIVAHERTLREGERADAVRRFMRATARGYELAVSAPDEAAELLMQANPPGTFEDPDLVRESARWLAPRYREGKARWGEQDLQVWTDYPRFMLTTGRLTDATGAPVTGELDYAAFFTNAFLP